MADFERKVSQLVLAKSYIQQDIDFRVVSNDEVIHSERQNTTTEEPSQSEGQTEELVDQPENQPNLEGQPDE